MTDDHDGHRVPHEDEMYCLRGDELDAILQTVCEAAETSTSEPYTAGKVDGARAFHYLVVERGTQH